MVELLSASGILVIMASGIYAAVNMSSWMVSSARFHLEAQALAADTCWLVYRDTFSDLLLYPAITTKAVPTTHVLHSRGGTVRTAVLVYTDHVNLTVRVDWVERTGGANSESFSVDRYEDF